MHSINYKNIVRDCIHIYIYIYMLVFPFSGIQFTNIINEKSKTFFPDD